MTKLTRALLFWTLVVCACSPNAPTLQADSASTITMTPLTHADNNPTQEIPFDLPTTIPTIPKIIATVKTPHIDQGPNGEFPSPTIPTPDVPTSAGDCAYQWASKDLPKLSSDFQDSLQALQPQALAKVFVFGEDCVYADGTTSFHAMETDFNVTLQVSDLSDDAALGEWIVKVMQVVSSIPANRITGPRPGRVSIVFQSGSFQSYVNFSIDQYQALPSGLSNSEIYHRLQTP